MAPKTFVGGCHCRAIEYEVDLDLPDTPGYSRCNCTFCLKTVYSGMNIDPSALRITKPAGCDDPLKSGLPFYSFGTKRGQRIMCDKTTNPCGVHIYGHGEYTFEGTVVKYFSCNVVTLDQPQDGIDLSKWRVTYFNGRENKWAEGVKEAPYPGGCV